MEIEFNVDDIIDLGQSQTIGHVQHSISKFKAWSTFRVTSKALFFGGPITTGMDARQGGITEKKLFFDIDLHGSVQNVQDCFHHLSTSSFYKLGMVSVSLLSTREVMEYLVKNKGEVEIIGNVPLEPCSTGDIGISYAEILQRLVTQARKCGIDTFLASNQLMFEMVALQVGVSAIVTPECSVWRHRKYSEIPTRKIVRPDGVLPVEPWPIPLTKSRGPEFRCSYLTAPTK